MWHVTSTRIRTELVRPSPLRSSLVPRCDAPYRRAVSLIAVAALVASSATACGLLDDEPVPPKINSYVTGVSVLGDESAKSEVVHQQLGNGSADGPGAQVDQSATVVNGGSIQQTVTSTTPFTVVRIAIEELPAAASGLIEPTFQSTQPHATTEAAAPGSPTVGYRQITLSQESTEATIVLTIAQQLPGDRFVLYFAVANASGTQGPMATQSVRAIGVGTGDVQVTVSWDVDSDLDLHVIDPSGEEIYWHDQTSASGGALDLDSNPDCNLDHIRNENVTWEDAPPGTYTVKIDLFSSCEVEPTNYVVTIQVAGQETRTIPGTVTGEGDFGGEGAGEVVATFEIPAPAAG
jgi:hypothetical protein